MVSSPAFFPYFIQTKSIYFFHIKILCLLSKAYFLGFYFLNDLLCLNKKFYKIKKKNYLYIIVSFIHKV